MDWTFTCLVFVTILLKNTLCQRNFFVQRNGQQFTLLGQNFSFGGTNNYYIPFKAKPQVDDLFNNAKEMGVSVIRTWAFNVIGNPESKTEFPPNVQGYYGDYMHYWDLSNWTSAFNEGPNGLQRLDYAVKKAKETGIKLILALSNNWADYGGSEQMNIWYGLKHHDHFFTDWKTRMEYKKWVKYLLNRVNIFTKVAYKDEPSIFGWELMNEPRCKGCKDIGSCGDCTACKTKDESCTGETIARWVAEMAAYVKSIDKNHLLGVGDEGFLDLKGARPEWPFDGSDGDHELLAKVPEIDFLTVHMYPDHWGKKSNEWTAEWIKMHADIAAKYKKPFILEEFGREDKTSAEGDPQVTRNEDYDRWTKQVCESGGNWMFWMLSAREAYSDTDTLDGKKLYPDYDKFTVYYKTSDGIKTPSGIKMQERIIRTKTRMC